MSEEELAKTYESEADAEIERCLSLSHPKSFFLFAGAGSGKTRSLVNALEFIKESHSKKLILDNRKIGVITYTNAACDEIKARLEFNDLFHISTIHSFVWSIINHFHSDIKEWLLNNLQSEISELVELERKGRSGTKASSDRKASITTKQERLDKLYQVKRFTYNPNGENAGIDALNHSEVIKISSDFLSNFTLMQQILISKFPILLIDESQDTNKLLMEAFLKIELFHKEHFLLGLFGDRMQRIYADGKVDLGINLPLHWAKPEKPINHRCPIRVISLINTVRSQIDNHIQKPGPKNENGFVRVFILPNGILNKDQKEKEIEQRMSAITGDSEWKNEATVKKLILEHHMAARRLGFIEMFESLYKVEKLRTGLLEGSLSGLTLFSNFILPLMLAKKSNNEFMLARLVRMHSPLLDKEFLKSKPENQLDQLQKVNEGIEKLFQLWNEKNPSFKEMLNCVVENKLANIPNSFKPFFLTGDIPQSENPTNENEEEEMTGLEEMAGWEIFLSTPFNQIASYQEYVSGKSAFDTHQGIKGRQFPRVVVIIDDSETRGFLFKYDKLFEVGPKTVTDLENERQGNDTASLRARRLFYVTCSRAEKSLAIVAYSNDPSQVQEFMIASKWFMPDEIELIS